MLNTFKQFSVLLPCFLALSACGGGAGPDAEDEPVVLRVLSHSFNQEQGTDEQIEALQSQMPELLALQLVGGLITPDLSAPEQEEQLAAIAAAAQMPYYRFARATDAVLSESGLLILSRYPIDTSGVESLPVSNNEEPRIALWAEIDVPGVGPLIFINTKLETHAIEQDRLNQVARLNELFAGVSVTPAGDMMPDLVVLAGDFGADTGNDAIDLLQLEFSDAAPASVDTTYAAALPRNPYKKIYRLASSSLQVSQSWVVEAAEDFPVRSPLGCSVIAHRGASAYLPEHTTVAYDLAVQHEADYLEPDVVLSKDGVPVVRHENQLSLTTDIALRGEFAARKSTRLNASGAEVEDWYSEDFTYAEISTLRAIERYPDRRPDSAAFDGVYPLLTLQQAIDFWQQARANGSDIKLYPEIKVTPGYEPEGFDGLQVILDTLALNGLTGRSADVLFQSFDGPTLQRAAEQTDLPLVQYLTGRSPEDIETFIASGGLDEIAEYADGVGVNHAYVYTKPPKDSGEERQLTPFVDAAHAAGLFVHVFTFRAENPFLPVDYRDDEATVGNLAGWLRLFFEAGVDGVIVDQTDTARVACNDWLADDHRPIVVDFEY